MVEPTEEQVKEMRDFFSIGLEKLNAASRIESILSNLDKGSLILSINIHSYCSIPNEIKEAIREILQVKLAQQQEEIAELWKEVSPF